MFIDDPPQKQERWPLAALCCFGILCFLMAATIVLALIPLYLSTRQVTVVYNNSNDTNIFYIQYTTDADAATSQSGSLNNTDEINNALDFGNDAKVIGGFVKVTNDGQNSSLGIALKCQYKIKSSCNTVSCHSSFKHKVDTQVQQLGTINNFSCAVLTAGVITRMTITARYVALIQTNFAAALVGYGAVDSLTFVAIRDGDFNDPSIWLGGVVPFAQCSIIISVGITVSFARAAITFPLKKIDIYGGLACGAGSSSFQFDYATNIVVHSGGVIQDLTSNRNFIFPGGSLLTLYSGGSFSSAGTVIQTYSSAGLGNSTIVNSASGPFTCGILPDGSVLSFPRVTFIVTQSGDFTSGETFLGGDAPSNDVCSDGCGLYVPSGFTLSTADLNGTLDLNIAKIDVDAGASLDLGTSGFDGGFKFKFPVQVNVLGALLFSGSGGGIFIPGGNGSTSAINFYDGGSFNSTAGTFIQIFNESTGVNMASPIVLPTIVAEPFFPTVTEPSFPTVTEPTFPTVPEPTFPIVAEPTFPIVAEPTFPIVAEPTFPTVPEPIFPTVPEPIFPIVAEPTFPTVAEPTFPTVPIPAAFWIGTIDLGEILKASSTTATTTVAATG